VRRSPLIVLAAAIAVFTSCSNDFSDPTAASTAGPLNLVLTSPNTDDGALLLDVAGGPIDSVTVASGYTLYDAPTSATAHRLIVRGDITNGTIATIWVEDQGARASYSVTFAQVARRGTFQQRAVTGYSATLAMP
jgi:hypothetical protein